MITKKQEKRINKAFIVILAILLTAQVLNYFF